MKLTIFSAASIHLFPFSIVSSYELTSDRLASIT
jgi:hypothetical protein